MVLRTADQRAHLSGGRNRANLDLAEVRKDMAVAGYEKTIQTAFREVADALAATDTLRREELAQRALADSSQEAMRLAEARYRGGVDGYLRYLDAQRHAFANRCGNRGQHTAADSSGEPVWGSGWRMARRRIAAGACRSYRHAISAVKSIAAYC